MRSIDTPIRVPALIRAELRRRLHSGVRGWVARHNVFVVLPAAPMLCWDGLRLSVQAGPFYASAPQHAWDAGYTHVEVASASRIVPKLQPYATDAAPAGRICERVPIETVVRVIAAAGGLLPEPPCADRAAAPPPGAALDRLAGAP